MDSEYQGRNKEAQIRGQELGLTREQVLNNNFGLHTTKAIEDDLEKGADLQEAFEKYSKLNNSQKNCIKRYFSRKSCEERQRENSLEVTLIVLGIKLMSLLKKTKQRFQA